MMTGDHLRHWRHQYGLSLRQLALLLGVHFVTVYNWERGRYRIAPRWRLKIAVLAYDLARQQPMVGTYERCGGSGLAIQPP